MIWTGFVEFVPELDVDGKTRVYDDPEAGNKL